MDLMNSSLCSLDWFLFSPNYCQRKLVSWMVTEREQWKFITASGYQFYNPTSWKMATAMKGDGRCPSSGHWVSYTWVILNLCQTKQAVWKKTTIFASFSHMWPKNYNILFHNYDFILSYMQKKRVTCVWDCSIFCLFICGCQVIMGNLLRYLH